MGKGSQALQGAAGGAMAGSVFGPVGTIGGGLLGGVAGWFGSGGSGDYASQLQKLSNGWGKRGAPQAGPASQAGRSGLEGNRAGLIAQLEAMARGEGPSAASIQMREAMDRAAGAQASAAAGAGGRGVNAGAALRNASNNTAAVQAQGARDTATLRAQEQMSAVGQLGDVVGQGINADNALNTWNAGAQNQMSQANLQAQLSTLGMNDQAQLQALMAAMGVAGPGLGTQIMAGGAQAFPAILQYNQQKGMMDQMRGQGGMGGGMNRSIGGGFGGMGGGMNRSIGGGFDGMGGGSVGRGVGPVGGPGGMGGGGMGGGQALPSWMTPEMADAMGWY